MAATALIILHAFSYLIFKVTLKDAHSYYFHFINKETKAQRNCWTDDTAVQCLDQGLMTRRPVLASLQFDSTHREDLPCGKHWLNVTEFSKGLRKI